MKTILGATPIIYPIPIILCGANVKGKPNFELLGDCGLMGINPPLLYVSSHKEHYTNIGILENKTFSINIPNTKMLPIADYCGTVSGHSTDKSRLFNVFYGETGSAPMIDECPVNIECKVIHEVNIKHRQIFIGEVVQTYANEDYITEKKRPVDLIQFDPIIYSLDNNYYSIGKIIGEGYKEAAKYQKMFN